MPIYEYECVSCGHRLEVIQKVSDPLLEECPECNEATLRKLISAAGFRLKGTGWYVTDFRDKGSPKHKGENAKQEASKQENVKQDNAKKGEASGAGNKPDTSSKSKTSAASPD